MTASTPSCLKCGLVTSILDELGPRVLLTIPKTFVDDFEVISVIRFAQDNLESNFIPRYV